MVDGWSCEQLNAVQQDLDQLTMEQQRELTLALLGPAGAEILGNVELRLQLVFGIVTITADVTGPAVLPHEAAMMLLKAARKAPNRRLSS